MNYLLSYNGLLTLQSPATREKTRGFLQRGIEVGAEECEEGKKWDDCRRMQGRDGRWKIWQGISGEIDENAPATTHVNFSVQ